MVGKQGKIGAAGTAQRMRTWAIRGVLLAAAAGVVLLAWLAQQWVDPERVRAELLAQLQAEFPGMQVEVGGAQMRLLGGIAVQELRLSRPGEEPWLRVPHAVLYHDKQQLQRGRLVIRKIVLESPELALVRRSSGEWNVAGVLRPASPERPLPLLVIQDGVIHFEDGRGEWPSLTCTGVQATVLNDPLPVIGVQVRLQAAPWGAATVRGRYQRTDGSLAVGVELSACPLPAAWGAAGPLRLGPFLEHLRGLEGSAAVSADLSWSPSQKWQWTARADLHHGRWVHPQLPAPLEKLSGRIRWAEGRLLVDHLTAEIDGARLRLSLESRPWPLVPSDSGAAASSRPAPAESTDAAGDRWLEPLQKLELAVHGVTLNDALFGRLPVDLQSLRRRFRPAGRLDVLCKFQRQGQQWQQEIELRPQQMEITYDKFRYPLRELRGNIRLVRAPHQPPQTVIDLIGNASGQVVSLKGTVSGDGPDPAIQLRISGNNIPLDEQLIQAFPPKYAALLRRFRPRGVADFIAEITQPLQVNRLRSEFRIDIRDGAMCYEQFPYPLEQVKGRLIVRVVDVDPSRPLRPGEPLQPPPDEDEVIFDNFTAVHAGAAIRLHGHKRPLPGRPDRLLSLQISGTHCPCDADLDAALGAVRLGAVRRIFQPQGHFHFTADVHVLDRAPPQPPDAPEPPFDPTTDLKLTMRLWGGPSICPSFFPYPLQDLSGWLEYKNGRLELAYWQGRHGETSVKLEAAEVRFFPDGSLWANVGQIVVQPLRVDAALLAALPRRLAEGLRPLQLRGENTLLIRQLVVRTPPDRSAPPVTPGSTPAAVGLIPTGVAGSPGGAGSGPIGAGGMPGGAESGPAGSAVTVGGAGSGPIGAGAMAPGGGGRSAGAGAMAGAELAVAEAGADPIIFWNAELRLHEAAAELGVSWNEVEGVVACRGRYEGTHMGAVLGGVWLDRAVVADQPVQRVSGRFRMPPQQPDPRRADGWTPLTVEFRDLHGEWFHGQVAGEARVILDEPLQFQLWLTAADVQLEALAAHYKLSQDADLKGLAQGQLYLYQRPDPANGQPLLEGAGKIDVPSGRMYNLPILLDLLKVLKLQAPNKTAFEEAHAVFRVRGDRILVDQIDLIGKAICMGGSGEMDVRGEHVQFEFYTIGSQVLARLVHTPVGDLSAFLSRNLFRIRMSRERGELVYRPEPVPLVTDPIRRIADRLRAQAARWFASGSAAEGR